jgi:selenocysteine lyase/cysteine desulfurase
MCRSAAQSCYTGCGAKWAELLFDPNQIALEQISPRLLPMADAADRLRRAGIRTSERGGAVRAGFHVYDAENDLDRLLDALKP